MASRNTIARFFRLRNQETMTRYTTILIGLMLVMSLASAQEKPTIPAGTETDARLHADGKGWRLDKAKVIDPGRPRVLLIGDSILNGYLKQVTANLNGKAYVDAWVNPYCQSEHLNKLLAEVLEHGPYDVIHFNMGLHGWQEGRIKPGTFEPLTKAYVQVIRDKSPKTRIIWASSTPVTVKGKPTELSEEINPIIVEHNRMAANVMKEMNVPVNDFYSLLVDKLELARGDQFHWKPEAYQLLAKMVTESVLRELAQKPADKAADKEANKPVNTWSVIAENEVNPRRGAGLVWHDKLKRFVLFGGVIDHEFKGKSGYQVQSFDPQGMPVWQNDLPEEGKSWGGVTGEVEMPGYTTPYFQMKDKAGVVRPNPRHMLLHYQYALAPWDGSLYMLATGHLLRYDPVARVWLELEPKPDPKHGLPASPEQHRQLTLNWGALAADPVNQELVLFGGCGVPTEHSSPGTWVYSTANNEWRKLELKTEPSPRALAPLAFDPLTKKIVLFGGDFLDGVGSDTWTYDCQSRTWTQQRPELSPAPRFGHALLSIPAAPGKVLLAGGNTITSSTSYQATLYRPLPFELWIYDVASNRWDLLKRFEKEELVPTSAANNSNMAALNNQGDLLFVGPGRNRYESSTYLLTLDISQLDTSGAREHGVAASTVTYRTGPYDPEWYEQDVPPVDREQAAKYLESLAPNQWTQLSPPKWPHNRQVGGWSTVAYDTDRQQFLHLGGGHSSYFGNDVAHYDTLTNRWSISGRPQFALHYNYDLTGPGYWAFNNGPWGNHNYHAYQYDPVRQRLVFVRNAYTFFYDPVSRTWKFDELIRDNPFTGSKYTTYLVSTPAGIVAWANEKGSSDRHGIYRLTKAGWEKLTTTGETLPRSITDGSTITFDSRRNQLLLTTSNGEKDVPHSGQIWSVDLTSGEVKKLNPAGRKKIVVRRFGRESVYLPKLDLVMIGYHLGWADGKKNQIPFYDIQKNRWLVADLPGSEFFSTRGEGSAVDLGLIYDAPRDLVWAVMCKLHGPQDLQAIRLDDKLPLTPLE